MAAEVHDDWRRTYVIATAAIIGATLAYTLVDWSGWTRLTYDPYSGRWWWPSGPTRPVPINYYGTMLWGVGGGVVGAAIGAVIARWPQARTPAARSLLGAWAFTSFALAGSYYFWNLWPL
jgi:prolipoprotein diacylglyceryltransferase